MGRLQLREALAAALCHRDRRDPSSPRCRVIATFGSSSASTRSSTTPHPTPAPTPELDAASDTRPRHRDTAADRRAARGTAHRDRAAPGSRVRSSRRRRTARSPQRAGGLHFFAVIGTDARPWQEIASARAPTRSTSSPSIRSAVKAPSWDPAGHVREHPRPRDVTRSTPRRCTAVRTSS